MSKTRAVLGVIAGIMLILSSVAHSTLGWRGLSQQLTAEGVPNDLLQGVKAGWQFAGLAMLVFGVIALVFAFDVWRGVVVRKTPLLTMGIGYVGFFLWALTLGGWNPFLLVFLIPGILLLIAAS